MAGSSSMVDLEALRAQVAETRKRLQEEENALAVIERMERERLARNSPVVAAAKPPAPKLQVQKPGGIKVLKSVPTLMDEVRRAIRSFGNKHFMRRELEEKLKATSQLPAEKFAAGPLSAALTALANMEEIALVFPAGGGSTPNVYMATPKLKQGRIGFTARTGE